MKNKFRILKILITVILFGFLLSFSLKRFNAKPLENISVKLAQTTDPVYFVDEKDVREMVKKSNPTKRIGDLNIPELEKKLNKIPAVDSANVYLNLNGNLMVDIKQRVPAFRMNKNGKDFYVDESGAEFPLSENFSFPCMLVKGDVQQDEYKMLSELVKKINTDPFSKKYFIGISKEKDSYHLLTSDGNYKVEIGDLDKIDLKVKGFKTFVEKYLIYQLPEKYTKISVRYDNQIVTTLNPNFKDNDSIVKAGMKELAKTSLPSDPRPPTTKTVVATEKKAEKKAQAKPAEKSKNTAKPVTTEKKKTTEKPKAVAAKKTEKKAEPKVEKKTSKAKIKIE